MPIWRNKPSMPKVRASSGTMGTTCLPRFLSRSSTPRMRTKAMVVEMARSPVPSSTDWKAASSGTSRCVVPGLRCGRKPPSELRRSRR